MRYAFLRSASGIIVGIGVVIAFLSVLVGFFALINRPDNNEVLVMLATIAGGLISGLFIAAGGQLLKVFIDISDDVQKIEELLACHSKEEAAPRESIFA